MITVFTISKVEMCWEVNHITSPKEKKKRQKKIDVFFKENLNTFSFFWPCLGHKNPQWSKSEHLENINFSLEKNNFNSSGFLTWKGILTKNTAPFIFSGYSIGQILSLHILTDYTFSYYGFRKFPRHCLLSVLYKQFSDRSRDVDLHMGYAFAVTM